MELLEPNQPNLMDDFYFYGCHFKLSDTHTKTIAIDSGQQRSVSTFMYDVEVVTPVQYREYASYAQFAYEEFDIVSMLSSFSNNYAKDVLSVYMSRLKNIRVLEFAVELESGTKFSLIIGGIPEKEFPMGVDEITDTKFELADHIINGAQRPYYLDSIKTATVRNARTYHKAGLRIQFDIPLSKPFPFTSLPIEDMNLLLVSPSAWDSYHKVKMDKMDGVAFLPGIYGDLVNGAANMAICDLIRRGIIRRLYHEIIASHEYNVKFEFQWLTWRDSIENELRLMVAVITDGPIFAHLPWHVFTFGLDITNLPGYHTFDYNITSEEPEILDYGNYAQYMLNLMVNDIGRLRHHYMGDGSTIGAPNGVLAIAGLTRVGVIPIGNLTTVALATCMTTYLLTSSLADALSCVGVIDELPLKIEQGNILVPVELIKFSFGELCTVYESMQSDGKYLAIIDGDPFPPEIYTNEKLKYYFEFEDVKKLDLVPINDRLKVLVQRKEV